MKKPSQRVASATKTKTVLLSYNRKIEINGSVQVKEYPTKGTPAKDIVDKYSKYGYSDRRAQEIKKIPKKVNQEEKSLSNFIGYYTKFVNATRP